MPDPDPTHSVPLDPTAEHSAADPAATRPGTDPDATVRAAGAPAFAGALPVSAGRYLLGAEIARGGMGAVYRATDTAFGREVAMKVLQEKLGAAPDAVRRFDDEARITGQLQHPGIPPVHDLGTLPDGRPFLAMKLIEGDTLARLLRARPEQPGAGGLSPAPPTDRGRFVAVFEQVCQAVAYAHAHNVIHRDLKPANVMVGSFGEVQVMDWGLAKVLGASAPEDSDPDATADQPMIRSPRESDTTFTQAGAVLGTPAFMPPEQAIGAINTIDARSDVFGLGAILAVILTGKPPFAASSADTTRLQAARGDVAECFTRLDASGAEPELVSLCKRCLSPKPEDRPADAGEVARAVAELRAAADERARQAELDRVKAEGDRAAAELQAVELRKRRRVQLALAAFVALVAIGGGVAAYLVQQERLAAEKKQSDERFAAEEKRQADLRAAAAAAAAKQRQTRAESLVQSLESADTAGVPRLIDDLKEYRDLTGPKLQELASQSISTKPGLHGRLALPADDPRRANDLAAYLPACRPEELLTIRDALKPHANAVASGLWAVLTDARAEDGKRVRAACALAGLAPDDARWQAVAPAVADAAVRANPAEFVAWSAALEPVRGVLVPELMKRYPAARAQIESGTLDVSKLVGEVSRYDLTANLLARYATDRPAELAELALVSDPRHYKQFADAVRANKADVAPLLKRELAKKPPVAPDGILDATRQAHGKRRGHAAAVLLTLGEAESMWALFAFPRDGDPTARSYLQERLAAVSADPAALVRRFGAEGDVSAKRALLLALGEYPAEAVPAGEREPFVSRLLALYRDDPDSGLHGAIDWLLRQKWGQGKALSAIDAELAAQARGRVAARAVAGAAVPIGIASGLIGPQLPAPRAAVEKHWFVNGEGQTFAVVRGPVEFTLGSPLSEPGRIDGDEHAHRKRIARTFAIATKEMTVEQFLRFRPDHGWVKRYSPGPDTPAVSVTWYDCAAYCNWLSAREGIPRDQWCYEPNQDGDYAEGMRMKAGRLTLTGYRMPTEAEWEFACRAGAVTSRYHGRGEELLPRYGWLLKTADDPARPVGALRPNDLGLFDALGNAFEWCEDRGLQYDTSRHEDIDSAKIVFIDDRHVRVLRGGSFVDPAVAGRCANRGFNHPSAHYYSNGFRPARTLP